MDISNLPEDVQKEIRKLEREYDIDRCMDANMPKSRPSPAQAKVLEEIMFGKARFSFVLSGNQCIAKGTEVLTNKGVKCIENIKIGDIVYSETGSPIKVLETHYNGEKEVVALTHRSNTWVEATDEHVFLTKNSSNGDKQEQLKIGHFKRDTQIERIRIKAPLGDVHIEEAYALGAMLGDGACTCQGVTISSADPEVPAKVGELLKCDEVKKNSIHNYNWTLKGAKKTERYIKWCDGKKSYEKFVDLEDVKTWDRSSVISLLAGLIDTDGCVRLDTWNNVTITIGMQALSAIQFVQWAFLTLWQVPIIITKSDREKYKNGCVYTAKIANNIDSLLILSELDAYLVVPRRKYKKEYEGLVAKRTTNSVGIKKGNRRVVETYDITVDSFTNLYVLANGMITHNSGKTSMLIRTLAWILDDTHPYWERPSSHKCNRKSCGNEDTESIGDATIGTYLCRKCNNIWRVWSKEPLVTVLVAHDRRALLENIWNQRLKPMLREPDMWKPLMVAGFVTSVVHSGNGNKIIFMPFGAGAEQARKIIQGYSCHFIACDELSPLSVIEECTRRIEAKLGTYLTTFTLKEQAPEFVRFLRATLASGASKTFRISRLDNPLYKGQEAMLMAALAGLTEAQKERILYGTIDMEDETQIFHIDYDYISENMLPPGYDKGWPHVLVVDPAVQSLAGVLLAARDPETKIWWVVKATYISKMSDPADLLQRVLQFEYGYNVVKRVSDSMAWFISTAKRRGIKFSIPPNKHVKGKKNGGMENSGKMFIIKKAISFLNSKKLKIYSGEAQALLDELPSYQFADEKGKIKSESKYHLIDCFLYLIDALPKGEFEESVISPLKYHEEIRLHTQKMILKGMNKKVVNKSSKNTRSVIASGRSANKYLNSLGFNGGKGK